MSAQSNFAILTITVVVCFSLVGCGAIQSEGKADPIGAPTIQTASWEPSIHVSEQGNQTSGVEITALIKNSRSKPISEIEFVVEQRQEKRTVPIAITKLKWPIPGGIEAGSTEPTKVFVSNSEIKRQSGCNFSKGCKLYVAISSIDYYDKNRTSEELNKVVSIEVTGPAKELPTPEEDANAGLFLKDEPPDKGNAAK